VNDHEPGRGHHGHGPGTAGRGFERAVEPGARRRGGGRAGHGRGRGRGGRAGGAGGGRGRRGDVRATVLALLAERPMHGYEMLHEIGRRTQGVWEPSPGSLYPALALLEDQGLVRSAEVNGRRRYELTEAGRGEQAASPAGPAPWEAVLREADQADLALGQTLRQVGVAIGQVADAGTGEQKSRAEALLAEVRRQTYLLLADAPASAGAAGAGHPSPEALWRRVEEYFDGALLPADEALEGARRASREAGLPDISVSPAQGKLLYLLARGVGARRILEIGTLGGYSAIWLARSLPPGGRLVSLEIDPGHAEVATANLAGAGLADRAEIRVGPAVHSLEAMGSAGEPTFDLVFIDADKQSNAEYFRWAMRLTHPGSIVVVDNVVRGGKVADDGDPSPAVTGVRQLVDAMAAEPRVEATTVQTVGSKGYDGFTIGLVIDP
jgi:predicted O-methyltransferase YrrM/DNA-binding PadR family transcriptional regulator